jgi:Ca2+-binding RTX toxin-like protein
VDGKAQAQGASITAAADKLTGVQWVGGTAPGSDTISIQALDGSGAAWGAADSSTLTTVAATGPLLVTPEVRVNTYTANDQAYADVAVLSDGGHVVVWSSNGQDGSGTGSYAQRYDAAGNKVGGEFLVNTTTSSYQEIPVVGALTDGGFVISWISPDGSDAGIFAQRYDASGTKVGGEFQVSQAITGNQSFVSITGLTNGGFVIAYQTANGREMSARLYGADGQPRGGEINYLNTVLDGWQTYSSVAALPGGGFVATWVTPDSYDYGIAARIFDSSGVPIGPQFVVNVMTNYTQTMPSITVLADGSFVVAWQGGEIYPDTGATWGILARRYSATGVPLTGEFAVNSYSASDQMQPSIIALSDGGFLVAWQSTGQDGSGDGIYGQRYSAAGTKLSAEFRISETVAQSQQLVDLSARLDGGFVAVWQSNGQDGSGTSIHSRVYTPNMLPGAVNDVLGTEGADTINAGIGPAKVQGLGGNDSIVGTAYSDTLIGGAGNDTLDGLGAIDSLVGGTGNDVFRVDDVGDVVVEASGEGTDRIETSLNSFTLTAAHVEDLTYTGTGAFMGTGNALANSITGGAGSDTLVGLSGDDTYIVDDAVDVVTEATGGGTDIVQTALSSLTLAANVENLTYTGTGAFTGTGSSSDNSIAGGASNDTLSGAAGNDTLEGGAGADSLSGGAGDDLYRIDHAGDTIVEASGDGTDRVETVLAAYTLSAEVEHLTYTGTADFAGTGSNVANSITGGAGNDSLSGGSGGADTLAGGQGDDLYLIDHAGMTVTEAADGGLDTVRTNLSSLVLATEVEVLEYTGTGAFAGTGNALANSLTGGAGDDTLSGGDGSDYLTGGAGADSLIGGAGSDTVDYSASAAGVTVDLAAATASGGDAQGDVLSGVENIEGSEEADTLYGDGQDNYLSGSDGDDTLQGRGGSDVIDGGSGQDTAVFAGNMAEYTVERLGAGVLRVTHSSPAGANDDAVDIISNIEVLKFADQEVVLGDTNLAPVAGKDGVFSIEGTPTVIRQQTLLGNDFDFDGDILSVASVQNAVNGTVELLEDGRVLFTPGAGFTGTGSFDYTIDDANGGTSTSTVTVTTAPLDPALTPVDGNTAADSVSEGAAAGTVVGVTASSAASDGKGVTYQLLSNAGGRFAIDATTGVVTVAAGATLSTSQGQQQTITVVAQDSKGFIGYQDFEIAIVNTAPTAPVDMDGTVEIIGDTWQNGTRVGLTMGSSDPGGAQVSYMLTDDAGGRFEIDPTTGIVTIRNASLLNGAAGSHIIKAVATDGIDVSAEQSFTITVSSSAGAPAVGQSAILTAGIKGQVNSYTKANQFDPSIAVLDDGGYVVTWTSVGQDGSGSGIYGQRFDYNGNKYADEFRVNTTTSSDQRQSTVINLSDGGFVVFWAGPGIKGQRYDFEGNKVGSQINVASYKPDNTPSATLLADGSMAVAWVGTHPSMPQSNLYVQRFAADGARLSGTSLGYPVMQAGDKHSQVAIGSLANGGFVVTWTETVSPNWNPNEEIRGQVFNATGGKVGGIFLANFTYRGGSQSESSVAGLTNGNFVVTWTSNHPTSNYQDIYFTLFRPDGTRIQGSTPPALSFSDGLQTQPKVVALADGGFLIAWTTNTRSGAGEGVMAQRYNANGSRVGSEFHLDVGADLSSVDLAARDDGGFVATWVAKDGSGTGIVSKVYAASASAPVIEGRDGLMVGSGLGMSASALLRPGHVEGDAFAGGHLQALRQYQFVDTDSDPASGHFVLDGVVQPAGQVITISAAQLPKLKFVGGSAAGSDTIQVRASDGLFWSGWQTTNVDTVTTSPVFVAARLDARVNSYTTSAQIDPAVSVLSDGGYVVTWRSYNQDGDSWGIYAQRYDKLGEKVGGEFGAPTLTTNTQANPQVLGLQDGGYMILWAGWGGGVNMQRYDPNGVKIGQQITVNHDALASGMSATLLSDGSIAMAWIAPNPAFYPPKIYDVIVQRIMPDGTYTLGRLGSAGYPKLSPNGELTNPDIAALADGGFVVTWNDYTSTYLTDVRVPVFKANGAEVGGITMANTQRANGQDNPSVAGLADGTFVVVWKGSVTGIGEQIFMQRFTATGSKLGSETRVSAAGTSQQIQPDVVALVDGGYLVSWTWGSNQDGSGTGIYAQRYTASGTKVGGIFRINTITNGAQANVALAARPDGGFVAVWESPDSNGIGIMSNVFGTPDTVPDGFVMTFGTDGNDTLTGSAFRDSISGGDGNDSISGGLGNDILDGGDGNDTLDGGLGADALYGGAGNDTYVVDNVGDSIQDSAGTDTILTTLNSFNLNGTGAENLVFIGTGDFTGIGDGANNSITGGAGSDTLTGNDGSDTLDGGAGADSMVGGAGDDTYIVDNAGDAVFEAANNQGIDTVRTSLDAYTLTAGVDNLVYTSTGWITATGNGLDNSITGGAGSDTLDGGTGRDTLTGGAGDDTYVTDHSDDVVVEAANAGNDRVRTSAASYTLSANIEDMDFIGTGGFTGTGNSLTNSLTGGEGDDSLSGSGGADTLISGLGNDTLDGGTGNDVLYGGLGDDTYVIDNAADTIVEADGQGTDTIRTALSTYGLAGSLENLTYTGTGNFKGTGQISDNIIIGGNGNDTLDGNMGADTLIGGNGNDLYMVDNAGDVVIEQAGGGNDTVQSYADNVTITGEIENVIYTGNGNFTGTGNAIANYIKGRDGYDTLDGGAGIDTLEGGWSDDIYIVDNSNDVVIEASGSRTDTVKSSADAYTLSAHVERLVYTGTGGFAGTGNALDNTITGGAGADTLQGGTGNDTLEGGLGDDTYVIDGLSDVMVDTGGTDTVRTSLATYTLGSDLENLTFIGGGSFTGTGNAAANVITGGNWGDTLTGLDGVDTLVGAGGDDVYNVEETGDQVVEQAGGGNDHVRSTANVYTLSAEIETLTFTGSGTFTGTGNASANSIKGGTGDDTLDGAAGADMLDGGDGNDTYAIDDAGDTIIDSAGTDTVRSSLTAYTLAAGLEHLVFIGTGSFAGTGNAAANSITGGTGNDTLDGGAGADTLAGGAGNDTYNIDDAGDVVTDTGGTDTVRTALASHTLAANIENLVFTGVGDFVGTGNGGANSLTGGVGNDTLDGQGGNDTLDGGVGADRMLGGLGNDTFIVDDAGDVVVEAAGGGTDTVRSSLTAYTLGADVEHLVYTGTGDFSGTGNGVSNSITGGTGNDTLEGLDGNDTLSGGNGNDSLTGGNGNDSLTGGAGADTMVGGAGNDTYIVDNVGDVVVEQTGEGTDTVQSSVSFTLTNVLESLVLTGGGAINAVGNDAENLLTGNGAANSLEGGLGNDSLNGGGGADTLLGGAGDDLYTIDNTGDVVTELAGEGTDSVQSSVTYTLSAHVENLTLTGGGAINATGNDLANSLTGNGGANRLDGGTGADTMAGGAGDDTYLVDDAGDTLTEAAGQGTDRVETALAAYTLGANLENLTYTGSGDVTGTGNALANSIIGGTGNDTLDGGAGADTLVGGAGDDLYLIDNSGDVITEGAGNGTDTVQVSAASYTLSANIESLTYTGSGDFTGTGNAQANSITGGGGDDTLNGGTGVDTLTGGAGNDTYVIDNASDVINDSSGIDSVQTSLSSYTLASGLEAVTYTDSGDFSSTGNADANSITGSAGNDTLNGGAGADTLTGGAGDDTYVIDDASDLVVEAAGAGADAVQVSISSYTLSTNVENLTFSGSGDFTGTGNAQPNSITGGAGKDTLNGGTGADTLTGGAGDDTYIVDDAGDMINDSSGTDNVQTSLSSYTLASGLEAVTYTGSDDFTGTGNADANSIIGGAGNDTLNGGAGADTLTGGAGADRFVVDDGDTVSDFLAGDGDKLDLSGLDADIGTAGSQTFTWIDNGAFTNVAGELRWVVTGSDVKLLADRDGDGTADLEVTITGIASISNAELVL